MKTMIMSERPTYASGFGTAIGNLLRFCEWENTPDIVSSVSTCWKELPIDMGFYTQYSVTYAMGYKFYLTKLKPNVLVVFGSYPHLTLASEVKENTKVPLIAYITTENRPVPEDMVKRFNKCDLILTPSQFSKDMMVEANIETRIEVLRHGVDTDIYNCIPTNKEHDFLYYGDNNIRKQIPRLLQAFSYVIKKKDDVTLMISADLEGRGGRLGEKLVEIVKILKLDEGRNRLHYDTHLGNVPALPNETADMINKSKIFVMPSAGESFCLPVLEAAACGVPSICTDYTGIKEYLGDSIVYADVSDEIWIQWGFMKLVDMQDLADKMYDLLTDEKKYKRYSETCLIKAQQLTWDEPALQFKKYCEEIANGK